MKVADFVDRLAENMGVSRETAQEAYRAFIKTTCEALSRGEEVRLERLGKFVSHLQYPGQGRPQLEADLGKRVVEVTFSQFRSSREQLADACPFNEELFDDERE